MNEATIRRELYQMLRYRYNLWPDHFPDVAAEKQPGRPDLVVMNPKGPGLYVEVKVLNPSKDTAFAFSKITEGQRMWLSKWEEVRPYGSWLAIGTLGKGRALYLVPWKDWLQLEDLVRRCQDSLPFDVGPGYSTCVQKYGFDFRFLEYYKLARVAPKDRIEGESGWQMPPHMEELWTTH